MSEPDPRAVIERYVELMSTHQWDRFAEVLHPEYVEEYPQSGERFVGIANAIAVRRDYQGGDLQTIERRDAVGGEDRWVMTPAFTLVRIEGTSDRYTYVMRTRYPDATDWFVIAIVTMREGLIVHTSAYFAPDFGAPDWRAPYRERP